LLVGATDPIAECIFSTREINPNHSQLGAELWFGRVRAAFDLLVREATKKGRDAPRNAYDGLTKQSMTVTVPWIEPSCSSHKIPQKEKPFLLPPSVGLSHVSHLSNYLPR